MRELRRWFPLAALAVVVSALAALDALPRWIGLVHEVALPPLDLLADVRVLTSEARSPVVFVLGLAAAIAVRSVVLAAVLGWSRARLLFALRFYGVAALPALVAAALDFSGRAVLYAYVTWAGVGAMILAFVLLAPAAWTGSTRLRTALAEGMREGLRIGVLMAYGAAITVVILVTPRSGGWTIAAVPVSATLTALAARRLMVKPRHFGVGGVAAPAYAAALLIVVLVVASIAGDGDTPPRPERRPGTLVLVAGVDSSSGEGAVFRLDPQSLGYSCRQVRYFSYAGPGDGAPRGEARCPISSGARYTAADTLRPLEELEDAFVAQLADLPRPVVVVTHSQAAWIAWGALADGPGAGVRDLVMLAPFGETLVHYPRDGDDGPGVVGGAAARLLSSLGDALGFGEYDPDRPLPRALQATAGAAQRVFDTRLPRGIRTLAVLSRWDVPIQPDGGPEPVRATCPGWANHGALPTSADVRHAIVAFLEHRRVADCPDLTDAVGKLLEAAGAPPPD